MKRYMAIVALASAVVVRPTVGSAQLSVGTITARVGVIRTLWPDNSFYRQYLWSFYPEIEVGGRFIRPFLSWGASWGYWSDGVNQALPVSDMNTYSQSSHIFSVRIGFQPQLANEHWPIPVTVFGGFSYHLIKTTYIGGWNCVGMRGQDSNDQSTTAHLGLEAGCPIVGKFSLSVEAQQFVPLGKNAIDEAQKNRRAFKIGLLAVF